MNILLRYFFKLIRLCYAIFDMEGNILDGDFPD